MSGWLADVFEPAAEKLGMFVLLLVLLLVMWWFGALGALLLDHTLHDRYGWPDWPATLPGVELAIVPLVAIAAARWRPAADRLITLRASGLGPYLSSLMAMALVGLFAYMVWSWATPLTTLGPAPEFGVVRWLGAALGAAFVVVWLPLFPRITATLAGMVAGPALFAVVGYGIGADMRISEGSDGATGGGGFLLVSALAMVIWILGASWLSQGGRPLFHAAWSAAVMLCLTVVGIST